MEIISRKGSTLEFLVEGTNPAFANSLRRIMISEVPTLAIEYIDVHQNTSSLFNEVIAHRMGLIPLVFDPGKFNARQDCSCKGKGCALCEAVFVLDKKGPGIVTSGDMKSSSRQVKAVSPDIPIANLLKSHELKLEAFARIGKGNEHARHQAANASYQYFPVVSFKGSRADMEKAVSSCPKDVLKIEGGRLGITEPAKCDLCRCCAEAVPGLEIAGDETRIIFRVESVSGLEPEQIVTQAASILTGKAEELKKRVSKL